MEQRSTLSHTPNRPATSGPPVRRRGPVLFSALVLAAVLAPVTQNFMADPWDGFPLSYFPMFTKPRGETVKLTHPVGIRDDGVEINLPGRLAASGGMNQIRKHIRKTARKGNADELAERIARRIRRSDRPEYASLLEVRIVRSTFEIEGFMGGDHRAVRREVLARHMLDRSGADR